MDDPMAAIRRRQAEAEALVDDAMQAQAAADGLALREALGRMMGKTELFHRMVTSYSANARQLVSRVRQHQAANDFEEGVQTFHGFKGLSATLGAVNVAALAAKGEANARAEQWPSDTWLSDFDLAIGRACEALQRHSQALRDASSNA
jgi:HPt (histidine-containing phosphotransfer) domain-containing protein